MGGSRLYGDGVLYRLQAQVSGKGKVPYLQVTFPEKEYQIQDTSTDVSHKSTEDKKMINIDWKKAAIFAGGVLFGTAGIKVLGSKDAKKVYTNCTAAVLRAKESVLETTIKVQENAEDILAEAEAINAKRKEKEAEDAKACEEACEDSCEESVEE